MKRRRSVMSTEEKIQVAYKIGREDYLIGNEYVGNPHAGTQEEQDAWARGYQEAKHSE